MTSAELSASGENYHENTSSESTTTTTTITTNNHFEQGIVNCVVENGKPMDKNKLQQQQQHQHQQQFLNQQQQNQNNNINQQQQQQKFYQQQHQSMVPNKNNNGAGVSINDNLNESQQQQQQHYHYQAQPTQPQQPPFSPYRQHQQQQSFMIQHQWSDNNNGGSGGGSSVVSPARKLSMTLSPIGGHISKTSTMFNQDSSSNGDNGLLLGSSGGLGSLILNNNNNNNNSNSANSGSNSSNSDKSANLDSPLRQQQSPLTHHHHHMRSPHHQTNNTNSPSSSMSSSVDHSASSSSLFASSSVMMMHQQQQQQQQQYRREVDDELESLNQSISHVLLNGYGDDEDEDGNHVKSSGSVSGNGGRRENKMLNNGDDTTSDYNNNNNNNNNTNGSSPTDDNQQQQHGYGAHMMMMSNNNHSSFHNNNNMVDSTWEEDYLMMTSGMSNNGLTPEDLQEYYMMTGHDLMMSGLMNNNNNSAMNMMMMNNGSGLPNSPQANSSAAAAAAAAAAVEHPLGEHPSRTLFVRNISSHVEDTELREIFESFGPIRSLYTHCKHRGFVMISYYDIRHAKNAMKHLQHKIFKRRKIDIHYSIPKENPTEKDLNQGTLVVFNLDVGINNEELHQIFGSYGEIKEIRETPNKKHHKFIEFFDVRDADRAMKCLNKTDLRGKKIKIEPSRPGGARRNLMYQWQLENMPPLQGTLSNHSSNETSPDSMLFASSPYGNPIMDDLSSGTGMVGSISRQQIINENMMYNNAAAVSSNTMPQQQQQQQQQQQLNMSLLSQGNTTINNNVNNGVGAMYGGGATAHSPFALNKSIHSPQVQPFSLPQHHQPSFSPQQQQQQTSSPSSFTMSPHQAFASPHKSFHQANTWSPASMPSMNTTPLHTPMQPLVFAPNHSSLIHNASSNFRLMSPRIMDNGVESTPQMVLSSTQHMMMDSGSSSSSNNSNIHVHHHHHHDPSMPSQSSANMPASTYPPQSANNNPTGLPPTGANFTIVSGNPYANISNKSRSHSSATTTPGAQNGMHDRMRSRNRAMSAEDRKKFYLDLDKVKYGLDRRTTLMVKNIPNKYTQKMLLQTIDQDFQSKYDFFYLPIDFKNKCNVGYAFINFVDPLSIIPFCHAFHAKKWEKFNSEKVCDITYARIQGKQALVNHFQNSSLMCEDPSCRPVFGPAFFLSE